MKNQRNQPYGTKFIRSAIIGLAAFALLAGAARAATFTWNGTGNASVQASWLEDGNPATRLPAAGDDIVLNGTSTGAMTWNSPTNGLPDTVASWTQSADYTGTVTIDTRYAGQGSFELFTINGALTINGGVWRHSDNSVNNDEIERYRLNIKVNGDFTLGAAATMNVDSRGYMQGRGPGKGNQWMVAASHGGQGGKSANVNAAESFSYDNLPFAATYGSIRTPTRLGSGSGSGTGGGGAVRIEVAGDTQLDGRISARGVSPSASSGGSIWLQTGALSGTGTNDVSGGLNAGWGNTGAGGGRIAVIVTNAPTAGNVVCRAFGGLVSDIGPNGAAGTIYIETKEHDPGEGRLIVNNNNSGIGNIPSTVLLESPADFAQVIVTNTAAIALNGSFAYDFATSTNIEGGGEVRVQNATGVTFPNPFTINKRFRLGLDVPITATGDWTIATNGVLTHGSVAYVCLISSATPTPDPATKLSLTLTGNLTVANGGRIDVDAKGHGPARGTGRGKDAHQTAASHGGQGGTYSSLTPVNPYGSIREPFLHGSGNGEGAGGYAGGVIKLNVSGETAIESGAFLTAKGTNSSSGGSIWLRTGTLSGSGTVDATGATPYSSVVRSSGGGGRIAVYVTGAPTTGSVVLQAFGGSGSVLDNYMRGAAGTVYVETQGMAPGNGSVLVDNYDQTTLKATTWIEASTLATPVLGTRPASLSVVRRGRVRMNRDLGLGDLTVNSNAELDLRGKDITVYGNLLVAGTPKKVGTYTESDFGTEVIDTAPTGRIIVMAKGTLILIR